MNFDQINELQLRPKKKNYLMNLESLLLLFSKFLVIKSSVKGGVFSQLLIKIESNFILEPDQRIQKSIYKCLRKTKKITKSLQMCMPKEGNYSILYILQISQITFTSTLPPSLLEFGRQTTSPVQPKTHTWGILHLSRTRPHSSELKCKAPLCVKLKT